MAVPTLTFQIPASCGDDQHAGTRIRRRARASPLVGGRDSFSLRGTTSKQALPTRCLRDASTANTGVTQDNDHKYRLTTAASLRTKSFHSGVRTLDFPSALSCHHTRIRAPTLLPPGTTKHDDDGIPFPSFSLAQSARNLKYAYADMQPGLSSTRCEQAHSLSLQKKLPHHQILHALGNSSPRLQAFSNVLALRTIVLEAGLLASLETLVRAPPADFRWALPPPFIFAISEILTRSSRCRPIFEIAPDIDVALPAAFFAGTGTASSALGDGRIVLVLLPIDLRTIPPRSGRYVHFPSAASLRVWTACTRFRACARPRSSLSTSTSILAIFAIGQICTTPASATWRKRALCALRA
ncbi:hypothetical protein C8R44DRAFT_990428 [Mycena epipterygia]|nr:hypothetical protein C8R44DRAFT_990428 [Mycena epipterygia]